MDATNYYSSAMSVPTTPHKSNVPAFETSMRRSKKAPSGPPNDAAGLVCGTQFGGVRTTPLKGKGCPPPDQKFDSRFDHPHEFVPSKKLYHHATKNSKDAQPINPRRFDQTQKSSIKYSAFGVISDADQVAATKRPSSAFAATQRSLDTRERVLLRGADVSVDDDLNVRALARGQRAWKEQESLVRAVKEEEARKELARPKTAAPPSEARRMAIQYSQSNQDVFRYRYSGGICPDEYKFQSSRPPVPAKPPAERPSTARDTFVDARTSFSINRAKAMSSVGIY
jgi:hypothetical protein